MTRELTVVERFEQGTLLKVRPHSMYADQGYVHAYYVPDEARQSAGMEKVAQMDSPEEFFKENGAPDFKAIQDHVSAAEIAEQAEAKTLSRADGDIGAEKRHSPSFRRRSSRSNDDKTQIPAGVVKFSDPDANDDASVSRDPVERGYCWGGVKDDLLSKDHVNRLDYRNNVQQATTGTACVPMDVVKAEEIAMVAYLAAHDHPANLIGYFVEIDPETVQEIITETVQTD